MIRRRITRSVKVGGVTIGGEAPVSVQSMTSTDTANVSETVSQIHRFEDAGCDIVRVAVPNKDAAAAISKIKSGIHIPLVADIHFDNRLAILAAEAGADKLRINPGNIGSTERVKAVVEAAKAAGIAIRIGANAGSIDKKVYGEPSAKALVESALDQVKTLEDLDFRDIVISLKAFDVPMTLDAYRMMAEKVDYPLHLGVTEAGLAWEGTIRSAVGIGTLLAEGIGDTLRVSLTADPVEEVRVGLEILYSLDLREPAVTIISCPTCGRCEIDLSGIAEDVRRRLKEHPPAIPVKVAVMGCVVNGPGEAEMADVGIAGGASLGIIFSRGKFVKKVKEAELVDELMREIERIGQNSKGDTGGRPAYAEAD